MNTENEKPEAPNYAMLGCPGCKFADEKAMQRNEPCCTYPMKLVIDEKTDRCLKRRNQEPTP